jgi:hypothetical protein
MLNQLQVLFYGNRWVDPKNIFLRAIDIGLELYLSYSICLICHLYFFTQEQF